ncbi:hypothetical protein MKW94_013913 [Papaver nudicaule]|uniref:Patellin-4 n=2 Tax=Papaver nudicaule TaxID=74823 RepID=A0AA41V2Y2_PAPNU|nr:hypothetical protein [Papaver nudicaule]
MAAAVIEAAPIGSDAENGSSIKVEGNQKQEVPETNNVEEKEKEVEKEVNKKEKEGEEQSIKSDENVLSVEENKEEKQQEAEDSKDGNENGEKEVVVNKEGEEEEEKVEEIKETRFSDLKEYEKKALLDFKSKLEEAILQNKLLVSVTNVKQVESEKKEEEEAPKEKELEKKPETVQGNEQEEYAKLEESKQEDDVKSEKSEPEADAKSEKSKQEEEPEEDAKLEKSKQEEPEEDAKSEKSKQEEPEEDAKSDKSKQEEEAVGKVVEEKEKSENVTVLEEIKEKCTPEKEEEKKVENQESDVDKDISLWGVPLLPSAGSEATDIILLKFLRARDFKVNEAFEMLKNTLQWRKEHKVDSILDEDLGLDHLNSVAYMDGIDYEGHPICYNMYGIFENNELYQKTFGTEEQRQVFLRWRFQLMEKGIQKLDFSNPKGVSSLLQINDLKNSPGPSRKELRIAMKQAVGLLQDNYPEFVARNIFVNVPFWYYAFNAVLSPFLTQRTKSKFVFARPAKVTETLLRYIPAQQIPMRYGGMKRENDTEFSSAAEESNVTEVTVKSGSTEAIEIPAPESGATLLWDLVVLGWEVNYKEEFVPTDEGSYTIIIQKGKKMGSQEESVRNSFRNSEPGKVVLTVENNSFKKKRVLYRYKTKMISA